MEVIEENDLFRIWEEENILCCLYKKPVVDIDIAKKAISSRIRLSHNIPRKTFMDSSNIRYVSKAAREYYASEEARYLAAVTATLVTSNITRVIANFFVNFSKPKAPFQVFSSKQKAFEWLKSYNIQSEN